jgi:myo-inositol-1(or 4)-monophosphatase
LQALETILRDAVLRAGDQALALAKKGARQWLKSDGTPVTEADLEADRILREHLSQAPLDAGWQSEESAPQVPEQSCFWLADPIDGTREFANGGQGWCVSVALIDRGEPILAAIYVPSSEILFLAKAKQGAMQNDQPLRTSMQDNLESASLLGNMSLKKLFPEAEVNVLHALALRMANIANANHDGLAAFGHKQDWDIAAGDLLIREAGGISTDLQGERLIFGRPGAKRSGLVAAGQNLHPQLITRTRSLSHQ